MIGSTLHPSCQCLEGHLLLSYEEPTISYDDRVVAFNGFVRDGFGQVDGKEDRVHLSAERVEGSFEKDCNTLAMAFRILIDRFVSSLRPVLSKLLSANASG